jgi:hypothetical protein
MANESLSFLASVSFEIMVWVISSGSCSSEEGVIPGIADKVVYKAQGFNPDSRAAIVHPEKNAVDAVS